MAERSSAIRRQCLKGATCLRCGRGYHLECHHIIALQDGGPDSLENVAPLCHWCHKEWHSWADGFVEWQDFLKTDNQAIGMVLAQFTANGSFNELGMTPDEALGFVRLGFLRFVELRNSGIGV